MSKMPKNNPHPIGAFFLFSLLLLLAAFCLFLFRPKDSGDSAQESVSAEIPLTVILDAGHGGEDGGAVGEGGIYEKDLNLDITLRLEALLKQNGITVVCTRTEDILLYDRNVDFKGRKKLLDLAARLKISRETPNSIFVSIHQNSFSQAKYSGLQVYYSPNHPSSALLAQTIQSTVRNRLQPQNSRLIKAASSNIYLMDRITTPAVLVECGFLSNEQDRTALSDENYRAQLAEVLALAITDFLSQK